MSLRWSKDVRYKLQLDFPEIYGSVVLPPLASVNNINGASNTNNAQ